MQGPFKRGGQRKPMGEINVVPFIDVMLVLLVIFMITAPMLNQGSTLSCLRSALNRLKVRKITTRSSSPLTAKGNTS